MRPEIWKLGVSLTVAAVTTGVLMASSPAAPAAQVTLRLAPEATAFDEGMDVRDDQGRRVTDPARTQALRRSFVGSLFTLLTTPRLPRLAQALAILETWKGWTERLRRAASAAWDAFLDLFTPPARRRLSFSAIALWAMAFGFVAMCLLSQSSSPRLVTHLTQLSSIVIRR